MPHFTLPIDPDGLALSVLIGPDSTQMLKAQAAGLPFPAPLPARALIDSACDRTAVATRILNGLGLSPYGSASTQTAGGSVIVNLYTVSLSVQHPDGPLLAVQPCLDVTEFLHAPPNVDVLLGRDVLEECLLMIDGPEKRFTLADGSAPASPRTYNNPRISRHRPTT
jgi:hypothetical protein